MMSWSLQGRRAWVCGASKGIGRATALLLAERGAEVTLLARQADVLEALCAELPREHGQTHAWHSLDLGATDVLAQWSQAQAQLGPVSILINNTGGPHRGRRWRPRLRPMPRPCASICWPTRCWFRPWFPVCVTSAMAAL